MFSSKRIVGFIAAGTLSLLAMGAQAQALKLGHITPPSHVWHDVATNFSANLEKASGGKMKIGVSPLSKLGNEAQMINLMQSGAQQFGIFTVGSFSNREESFLAWSLPYTFKDVAHATRAAGTPAAKEMLAKLDSQGLVGVGYAFAGMRHVLSIQPVKSSKDLANKKIRSFPSPIYNDWWLANGAAPTALPLSEVAPGLTTKLLDAVDIDLDALVGLKFHQQAPNLTLTNHMAFPAVVVISKKWWATVKPADQEIVMKALNDAIAQGYKTAIDADVSNLAKAKADGAKVVDADLGSFQAMGAKVRDQYMKKNKAIADFYQQAKGL
jgi:TRAP-type transport system periplasmic protein